MILDNIQRQYKIRAHERDDQGKVFPMKEDRCKESGCRDQE